MIGRDCREGNVFWKGIRTKDTIGLLKMVVERYLERSGISLFFTELEKAFDRVKWEKMMEIM